MAYNHGRGGQEMAYLERSGEKLLRECGVDEATTSRYAWRTGQTQFQQAFFTDGRMTLREYLEDMQQAGAAGGSGDLRSYWKRLRAENLYQVLVTDGRTSWCNRPAEMQVFCKDCPLAAFDDWCHLCELDSSMEEAAENFIASRTACHPAGWVRMEIPSPSFWRTTDGMRG